MAILAFHNISALFLPGINNFGPARFAKLISFIIESEFKIIALSDYLELEEIDNEIALTFDDGYEDFYINAYPILSQYYLPATIFIPANYIGKKATWDFHSKSKHMTEKQLREISACGVDLESHGLTHSCLTRLNDRFLRIELERSKSILEDISGSEVKFLAYPFGICNRVVEESAKDIGYQKGLSLSYFKKSQNRFTVPRYAVYSIDTRFSIKQKMTKGVLNSLEKSKSHILNSFSYGTVFLNQIRKSRPDY